MAGGGLLQTGALTVQSGSTLTVNATSTIIAPSIIFAGTATLPTVSSATPITFGQGGTLNAASIAGGATVNNFAFGNSIDLTSVAAPTGLASSVSGDGGTLAVNTASGVNAYVSNDGAGGTIITPTSQTIGVFRFFEPGTGIQFYTSSATEAAQLQTQGGYVFEGAGGSMVSNVTDNGDPNSTPVYRFFDTRNGSHFYTISQTERDQLIANQSALIYEPNSTFNEHATQQIGDVPVYRFFDTVNGTHFFTDNDSERASILATRPDLTAEGIAYFESPHTS